MVVHAHVYGNLKTEGMENGKVLEHLLRMRIGDE